MACHSHRKKHTTSRRDKVKKHGKKHTTSRRVKKSRKDKFQKKREKLIRKIRKSIRDTNRLIAKSRAERKSLHL